MGALEKSLTKLGGGLETRLDKTEAQTQRLSRQLDKAGGSGGGGGGGGDSERMVQQLSEEAAATQLQLQQVIHSRQSVCCLEVYLGCMLSKISRDVAVGRLRRARGRRGRQ